MVRRFDEDRAAKAYPLHWPPSWKRTEAARREHSRFDRDCTVAKATSELLDELRKMGVPDRRVVISSNLRLRLDGRPYSDQAAVLDPGIAVFFPWRAVERVLACDRWARVDHNLRAIARHIEAMRGIERWGVGSLEQAFRGYTALPETIAVDRSWREVLELGELVNRDQVEAAFKRLARIRHPDLGGTDDAMAELNLARERAIAEIA
ncbi:MAG TPA: J domain-containing protein [Myxococcota bacterium]|nr:J domain-containing protein [Myxococcota bacterium]